MKYNDFLLLSQIQMMHIMIKKMDGETMLDKKLDEEADDVMNEVIKQTKLKEKHEAELEGETTLNENFEPVPKKPSIKSRFLKI